MGNFIEHAPCESCGSKDNVAVYDDGKYCFGCGASAGKKKGGLLVGEYRDLKKRCISKEICEKYGYQVGSYQGKPCHIANYYDNSGKPAYQKIRTIDKNFPQIGATKPQRIFGKNLFRPSDKIPIVITEGELDALSVAEAFKDNDYPIVSVGGAQGAKNILKHEVEWLKGFKQVVLFFDNDEVGRSYLQECADLFPPGKVRVVRIPLKDANEMLVAGRIKELKKAVWNAEEIRPDGIIKGSEVDWGRYLKPEPAGFTSPYPGLDKTTRGLHKGRITLVAGQPKAGKSTFVKEIAYHLMEEHKLKVGNILLEESQDQTLDCYLALHNNVPTWKIAENRPDYVKLGPPNFFYDDRIIFYNHFGSLQSDNLINKIEYMAVAEEIDFLILDHISMVVSGLESGRDGERKDIDILMTKLRSLVARLGIGIVAISHIKKTDPEYPITLEDLRGSGSLAQISDFVLSLDYNTKDGRAYLNCLANRYTGKRGLCDSLEYNTETGRLLPSELKSTVNVMEML